MTKPTKWVCAQRRLRSAWATLLALSCRSSSGNFLIWIMIKLIKFSKTHIHTQKKKKKKKKQYNSDRERLLKYMRLGKSCSFGLPRAPFVNCCQLFLFLVLRAGSGIWLYQFLIIAYLFLPLVSVRSLHGRTWGESFIMLVIYFTPPVNPFIARSGISQLREFPCDRTEFCDYARLQNWK